VIGGSVEEVTLYLSKLIQDGSLNACIEQSAKVGVVLRFFLDPTQGPLAKTEKQQQQALLEQTQRTNILAEQVKGADYRLGLTKEHIDHLKRQSKKSGTGAGDAMDTTWDDGMDGEEDIMVGL
jgi:COP9 signalosome complex subunit 3